MKYYIIWILLKSIVYIFYFIFISGFDEAALLLAAKDLKPIKEFPTIKSDKVTINIPFCRINVHGLIYQKELNYRVKYLFCGYN